MDSYRRRSEAEASMLQKRLDMAERTQRYPFSKCGVLTPWQYFGMSTGAFQIPKWSRKT